MSKSYVYSFSKGSKDMKGILGGKGANLSEMTRIGLPVPPGITITTEACIDYFNNNNTIAEEIEKQIISNLSWLESKAGKKFGCSENPLLVSVRSGAVVSMPGMMDTILNLGLNDKTVEGLAAKTGDRRFAFDCYRRFISMFAEVVFGIEQNYFEEIFSDYKEKSNVELDSQLNSKSLEEIVEEYKKVVTRHKGKDFPQDPYEQLLLAVCAVFDSWNTQRARVYRRINNIPDDLGTAVTIQAMVFGNMGNDSGTGVVFTRNPSNGVKELYGEFLMNAQGEDVVAGIRNPQPISELRKFLPEAYRQLKDVCITLEAHYKEMQDIEFTIEKGRLYLLQTRTGKRTAPAAIKIAVEMVDEGIITQEEAVLKIEPETLDQLLHPSLDQSVETDALVKGLPASPGAASGEVVFDPNEAERMSNEGKKGILVRVETTPDDIHGIVASLGVLTARGGMTSHAAVVARGMGKPCITGCDKIKIDYENDLFSVGDVVVRKGDIITIDGTSGKIVLGEVPLRAPDLSSEFKNLLSWADDIRTLGVRANADTPEDARKAREFGAKGIGLCRTEHMFMQSDRMKLVRNMILADTKEERVSYLDKLLPMQEEDFYNLLQAMAGYPVTIRLLDPPLHEFLPNTEELIIEIYTMKYSGAEEKEIKEKENLLKRVKALSETNPMLGHRGCRLGITYPEIYEMQVKAIFKAAARLVNEGYNIIPEIEIPLVMHFKEFSILRSMVNKIAEETKNEVDSDFRYLVGTMIEVPRACATAGEIAAEADFFSFGTNDLTQTTLGFSRDDAEGKFLQEYIDNGILKKNPFITLDKAGVGRLMEWAINKSRDVREDLLIGICGEHGGDPESIKLCHALEIDFISCSPFRIPIARLAAAQAALGKD